MKIFINGINPFEGHPRPLFSREISILEKDKSSTGYKEKITLRGFLTETGQGGLEAEKQKIIDIFSTLTSGKISASEGEEPSQYEEFGSVKLESVNFPEGTDNIGSAPYEIVLSSIPTGSESGRFSDLELKNISRISPNSIRSEEIIMRGKGSGIEQKFQEFTLGFFEGQSSSEESYSLSKFSGERSVSQKVDFGQYDNYIAESTITQSVSVQDGIKSSINGRVYGPINGSADRCEEIAELEILKINGVAFRKNISKQEVGKPEVSFSAEFSQTENDLNSQLDDYRISISKQYENGLVEVSIDGSLIAVSGKKPDIDYKFAELESLAGEKLNRTPRRKEVSIDEKENIVNWSATFDNKQKLIDDPIIDDPIIGETGIPQTGTETSSSLYKRRNYSLNEVSEAVDIYGNTYFSISKGVYTQGSITIDLSRTVDEEDALAGESGIIDFIEKEGLIDTEFGIVSQQQYEYDKQTKTESFTLEYITTSSEFGDIC